MFRDHQTVQDFAPAAPQDDDERLDPLLGFPAGVARRYEADSRQERIRHLRVGIVAGILSYNSYDLISFFTFPDVAKQAIVLRLIITALAAAVWFWLPRLTAFWREMLLLGAMLAACAVPLYLFAATRAPNGALSFIDFLLTIVFGIAILQVRFPAAIMLTAVCWTAGQLVVIFRPELTFDARLALSMQLLMASYFLLLSSWLMQRSHRQAYLAKLRETERSRGLELARQSFAELSMTDALTGLGNRRCLDEVLSDWLAETRSGRMQFALIMLDVDHFKAYNDRYGHPAGDQCLKEIGAALASFARQGSDVVARYGGEEFVVLMRAVSRPVAHDRARDLVEAIADLAIVHAARPDGECRVTVSAGLTHLDIGADRSEQDVLAEADIALYGAKRAGRGRIELAAKKVVELLPRIRA
ncbi:GGDEF domain-containing protein [Jiella pelagia]|uniref:diguanylate cyclase n=1 Tax=Jiella pelagia TaxID=2986949 RepID=A0ABY7C278_9HYPH|nr:GGDEF domain-containing protein [Jiella pelagia]WAP69450.1 GGDEF domain-containing protein [Jiella pelagia]